MMHASFLLFGVNMVNLGNFHFMQSFLSHTFSSDGVLL